LRSRSTASIAPRSARRPATHDDSGLGLAAFRGSRVGFDRFRDRSQ
jgi:hypothetical protein